MKPFVTRTLGFVLLGTSLSWGVYLDPERVISLKIARQGLTRLSVKKDKIQDIFVHPSEASNNIQLHKSGHVFLTPEGLTAPLSVTIITETGKTQDLVLRAVSKNPGPIYLEEKELVPPPISLLTPSQTPDEILETFVLKGVSPGFQEDPVTAQRQVQEVSFEAKRSWVNASYRVIFFEAPPQDTFHLSLAEAKRDGDLLLAAGPSTPPSFFIIKPLRRL